MFDQALVRAAELDEHLEKTGKTVGPLQCVSGSRVPASTSRAVLIVSGLPISLKDQINVKGVNHTMSYVANIGNKAEEDAVITEILLKQGVCHLRSRVTNRRWGDAAGTS